MDFPRNSRARPRRRSIGRIAVRHSYRLRDNHRSQDENQEDKQKRQDKRARLDKQYLSFSDTENFEDMFKDDSGYVEKVNKDSDGYVNKPDVIDNNTVDIQPDRFNKRKGNKISLMSPSDKCGFQEIIIGTERPSCSQQTNEHLVHIVQTSDTHKQEVKEQFEVGPHLTTNKVPTDTETQEDFFNTVVPEKCSSEVMKLISPASTVTQCAKELRKSRDSGESASETILINLLADDVLVSHGLALGVGSLENNSFSAASSYSVVNEDSFDTPSKLVGPGKADDTAKVVTVFNKSVDVITTSEATTSTTESTSTVNYTSDTYAEFEVSDISIREASSSTDNFLPVILKDISLMTTPKSHKMASSIYSPKGNESIMNGDNSLENKETQSLTHKKLRNLSGEISVEDMNISVSMKSLPSPPISANSFGLNQTRLASFEAEAANKETISDESSKVNKNDDDVKEACNEYQMVLEQKRELNKLLQEKEKELNVLIQERDLAIAEQKELGEALQLERGNSVVIKEAADKALLASDQEIASLRNECECLSKVLNDTEVKHSLTLTEKDSSWKQKLESCIRESDTLRSHLAMLEYGRFVLQKELNIASSSLNEGNFQREVDAIEALNRTLHQERSQRESALKTESEKICRLEDSVKRLKEINLHLKKKMQGMTAEKYDMLNENEKLLKEQVEEANKEISTLIAKLDKIVEGKSALQDILGIKASGDITDFRQEIQCIYHLLKELKSKEQNSKNINCNLTEEQSKTLQHESCDDFATNKSCDAGTQVELQNEKLCNHMEELANLEAAMNCQVNLNSSLRDKLALKQREIRALIHCLKREYNDTLVDYEKLLTSLMWVSDTSRERMKKLEDIINGQFH